MATSIPRGVNVRWIGLRNAILASPRFRRWASRFPLTQGVARARARETFTLVAGFVYSQILTASIESGLLDLLAKGPVSSKEAAAICDLAPDAALRLLRAASSVRIAEAVSLDRYMLGRVGAAIHADPGILAMVRHHRLLYADLADPLSLFRRTSDHSSGGGGALSAFWPYAEEPESEAAGAAVMGYSVLMAASQPMVAAQVIDAYDFGLHRQMLDVGGGEGAFAAAVGSAFPKLQRAVLDLPHVIARITDPTIARFPGSFLTDSLPTGFDLITLVRILHDHNDDALLHILQAARRALSPGGRLLIAEPMAGVCGDEAVGDGYFGMYLLAMGSGRPRSAPELQRALKTVGFARSRRVATALPLIAQVVIAHV